MWKTIEICPNYEVNEKGIVRTKKDSPFYHEPLEIIEDEVGYRCVRMHFINNRKITIPIHKLVAQAFIKNDEGFLFVGHKDYNIKNNFATNLIWLDVYGYKQYEHEYRKIKLALQENQVKQTQDINNQVEVKDIVDTIPVQNSLSSNVSEIPLAILA